MITLIRFSENCYSQIPPQALRKSPQLLPREILLPRQDCLLDYRVRIDNIQALTRKLDIDTSNPDETDLAAIIAKAYDRWHERMFEELQGDWWIAMWDARRRAIILAVDPTSPSSLFYAWTQDGCLAFSPSVAEILDTNGISRDLHESRMLSHLIHWGQYRDYLQTEYQAIRQIGSGTFTRFTQSDRETNSYWQAAQFQENRDCTSEAYVEEFLSRYRQAVHARLPANGRVASMLSAGLDSGSVTALAAERLMSENRTLRAYTHVPVPEAQALQVPGKLVNEWSAASQVAAMYPNIAHVAVESGHINPIGAAAFMLKETGRLQAANLNAAWIHHMHQSARHDGVEVLLSGQSGNFTVSWDGGPINIWDLLVGGEWPAALRYLSVHASKSWLGMSRRLAGDTLRYLHPARAFVPSQFTAKQTMVANPLLCRRWQAHFENDARQHIGDIASHRAMRNHLYPMLVTTSSFAQSVASAFGITVCDPTSDQRVVEWCLQVPVAQYRNESQNRLLIRNAMRGLLPEAIRTNHIRGLQPADLGYRYRQYRESVIYVLNLLKSSPMAAHYLDLPQIAQNWERCQTTMQPSVALFDFHKGLQAGLFFLTHEGRISADDFPLAVNNGTLSRANFTAV